MIKLIIWLAIGLAAGAVAKKITPQKEGDSWTSSLIVGIIGSFLGGGIANFLGLDGLSGSKIGMFLVATAGAVIVLFIHHKFLKKFTNWRL